MNKEMKGIIVLSVSSLQVWNALGVRISQKNLIQGLGGGGAQNNFPFISGNVNLGDYAWGTDSIVTQLMNNMENTGPAPLSNEKLYELTTVLVTEDQVKSKLQCSVCWEDFALDENVIKLHCEHLYRKDCILPWLKLHGTCPVCRKDLNQDGSDHNESPLPNNNTTSSDRQHQQTTNNPRGALQEDMEFD